jgi:single-stranded-DNA-specific exonuclease
VPGTVNAFAAEAYSYAEARSIGEQLGLSEPVAVTLVRRGYRTPEQARAFLAADESHPPAAFAGMSEAVELVRGAVAAARRITVHGDFDVDGVCATALTVSTLRRLGADCDWLIPDRLTDGYGLTAANVERLADRGTSLLITVDCGIACPDEVALAKELGMDVLVTDHHQPGESLPDCAILHPQVSGYPFESLCGTAVAWKLACALGAEELADLDLVALATVADVVPLVGENRALVRKGLAELSRGRRTGMRALMAAASCEPERLDEGDLGFRLAPRINAAGRLYRADAGVELFLTEDEARAEEIATELGRANSERRATEREVDAGAEAARRELPERLREAPGLVLAGEDWHPGVVGIVASRLVERHHRPAIVLSLDREGGARGSGRSIPGFDLLAALEACSQHLTSFGGHRAAAGLTLPAAGVDAFREAFAAHAASVLSPEDLRRTERIDAMVGGVGLGLELAEEISRLAPFGMGNPGVRLLVPSARVSDVRTMGEEGRHSRFSLHTGSHRALGVAFGRSSLGVEEEEPLDAAVRLEVNHWNGAVEPRVVLRELYPLADGPDDIPGAEGAAAGHRCECAEAEWWQRFEVELRRPLEELVGSDEAEVSPYSATSRELRHRRRECAAGGSATARIAELVSSGAGVLAVCADASRRAALASGATGLARFNGGGALVACHRCAAGAVGALAARAGGGLALTDYAALAREPALAAGFEHVVLVDPPASAAQEAAAVTPPTSGEGFLHRLWGEPELPFARAALAEQWASREGVAAAFRALREAGPAAGGAFREALAGADSNPLCAEATARRCRVLEELGLLQGSPDAGDGLVGVVSSGRTDLQRSGAFRAYSAAHAEAQRFLERPKLP